MSRPALALALAAALLAGAAAAQDPAPLGDGTVPRAGDRDRLDRLDASVGAALRPALAAGAPADVAVLVGALAGPARAAGPEALLGDWRCRTIKAGGLATLVVYDAFRCRGSRAADGSVTFEKLTGSQRVRGTVHRDGDRLVLLGVGYIAGDTPPAYAALPAEIDTSQMPQRVAAPGVVEMTGTDAGRVLFPFPMLESTLDILVLSR